MECVYHFLEGSERETSKIPPIFFRGLFFGPVFVFELFFFSFFLYKKLWGGVEKTRGRVL